MNSSRERDASGITCNLLVVVAVEDIMMIIMKLLLVVETDPTFVGHQKMKHHHVGIANSAEHAVHIIQSRT
jgi:hypothetical protein